jgi:hypothetical protein
MTLDDTLQPDGELITEDAPKPAEEVKDSPDEGVEKPAESATAEEGKKVQFNEEQQKVLEREIGKHVAKQRKAERELDEFRAKYESAATPALAKVDIPILPDPLTVSEVEFNRALTERDDALRRAAVVDAHNKELEEQKQQQQFELVKKQNEILAEKAKTYDQRATALGVTSEELKTSGDTLRDFGIGEELAGLILEDEEGPLLTKYLAMNLREAKTLVEMPIAQAAMRLGSIVKAHAASLKPKQSNAPDPIDFPASGNAPASRGDRRKVIEIY